MDAKLSTATELPTAAKPPTATEPPTAAKPPTAAELLATIAGLFPEYNKFMEIVDPFSTINGYVYNLEVPPVSDELGMRGTKESLESILKRIISQNNAQISDLQKASDADRAECAQMSSHYLQCKKFMAQFSEVQTELARFSEVQAALDGFNEKIEGYVCVLKRKKSDLNLFLNILESFQDIRERAISARMRVVDRCMESLQRLPSILREADEIRSEADKIRSKADEIRRIASAKVILLENVIPAICFCTAGSKCKACRPLLQKNCEIFLPTDLRTGRYVSYREFQGIVRSIQQEYSQCPKQSEDDPTEAWLKNSEGKVEKLFQSVLDYVYEIYYKYT
jgi:hypothetical protein